VVIKDTHRFVKNGNRTEAQWEENDGNVSVNMELADQQDSATLQLRATTLGTFSTEVRAVLGIRLSYTDLRVLVDAASEILVKHADEVRPF
jgi:hypothetical protein